MLRVNSNQMSYGLLLILGVLLVAAPAIPLFSQEAKLQKLTWGNPDQPWGVRRPVTDADRKAIASYRSAESGADFASNFDDPQ